MNLQQIIIRNLLTNEKYARKVIPHIKTNYFEGVYRNAFKELNNFVGKFNKLPTEEAFLLELQEQNMDEDEFVALTNIVSDIFTKKEDTNEEWLLNKTGKWIQDRAILLAVIESFNIIEGKSKKYDKGAIPDLLTTALGVTLDTKIGHDYFDDVEERFNSYHEEEERIPFDIELLNKITKGGIFRKTLTVLLAGTNVGKSLVMCHMAAANISMGYNVLYITNEMSEIKISERIDANLLDTNINELDQLEKNEFLSKLKDMRRKSFGKLIVKEYPTSQASVNHFRALLNELKLKKQFIPDIIYVDYLNICASARLKGMSGGINSYSYIKAIAEELRGLAVEFNAALVTATQTNREGFSSSDPELENTSESFGVPATADLMMAIVTNEEMEKDGQFLFKQLKNRYGDKGYYRRFLVGVTKVKMRLYDIDNETEDIIQTDDTPIMDKADKWDDFVFDDDNDDIAF